VKSYKEWYDYHYKRLKKQMPKAPETTLKTMAGDMATRSFNEQQNVQMNQPNIAGATGLTGSRVGRGSTPMPTPTPTQAQQPPISKQPPIQTNQQQQPTGTTYNDRMAQRIAGLGIKGYTNSNPMPMKTSTQLLAELTDAQYTELARLLKTLGYSVKEKNKLKEVLNTNFAELFPAANYNELLAKLQSRAIAGISTAGGRKGPTGPDVTTYLDVPREAELREKMKDRIFDIIQKRPGDDDPILNKLVADIKSIYEKGVTSTVTVDPKTGRKIVKQKGGVSEELIQSKLDKYYNSSNQDFLEAKSLEAADLFSQWMRS